MTRRSGTIYRGYLGKVRCVKCGAVGYEELREETMQGERFVRIRHHKKRDHYRRLTVP